MPTRRTAPGSRTRHQSARRSRAGPGRRSPTRPPTGRGCSAPSSAAASLRLVVGVDRGEAAQPGAERAGSRGRSAARRPRPGPTSARSTAGDRRAGAGRRPHQSSPAADARRRGASERQTVSPTAVQRRPDGPARRQARPGPGPARTGAPASGPASSPTSAALASEHRRQSRATRLPCPECAEPGHQPLAAPPRGEQLERQAERQRQAERAQGEVRPGAAHQACRSGTGRSGGRQRPGGVPGSASPTGPQDRSRLGPARRSSTDGAQAGPAPARSNP